MTKWHMESYGMDTVFHMEDNTGEMVNLFEYHNQFSHTQVEKWIAKAKANNIFNSYAIDALEDSGEWLMNSLAEELKTSVHPHFEGSGTAGPVLWMTIMEEVQSTSIWHLKKIEKKLEQMSLSAFKGENIRKFCEEYLNKCIELDNAPRLPDDILLTLVEALSKSTVEEFCITWLGRRTEVEKWMSVTAGKTEDAIAKMEGRLTYRSLLHEATTQYQSLYDSNLWGPAANAGDKSGAPEGLYSKVEVNALVQQAVSKALKGNKKAKTCHTCGKEGHFARNCPEKDQNTDEKRTKPEEEWKTKAPSAGEPETKTVKNLSWHWCNICKRWRVSHGTSGHDPDKVKKKPDGPRASLAATMLVPTIPGLMEEW